MHRLIDEVLNKLLIGNYANLQRLLRQKNIIKNYEVDFTGSGFYVNFEEETFENSNLPDVEKIVFGDVYAKSSDDQEMGFLLYVKNYRIKMLECYSENDIPIWAIPDNYYLYYYPGGEERDFRYCEEKYPALFNRLL